MKSTTLILFFCFALVLSAQKPEIKWLSFQELETALLNEPNKVMFYFYADWCVYCKKMENDVYTKPEIKKALANSYYAVKFNVESTDTIQFGGKKFSNLNIGKKRNAYHQIAELLARQDQKEVTLPAVVFLDKDFKIERRIFRYIPPKELSQLLED